MTAGNPPAASMGHVVLLGDSILDNKAYVGDGPDVITQVRAELPPGWKATLLAVDGDVISGVLLQLRSLPRDATHLVVSAGGNDALGFAYLLDSPARSVAEALRFFSGAQDRFSADYGVMAEAVRATGLPAAFCTIYDTPASTPEHRIIKTALAFFNDCITRAAFSRSMSLIDLRLICSDDGDYANPIEPSSQGGEKIARAIAGVVGLRETSLSSTVIAT